MCVFRSGKVERNVVNVRDQTWHDQTCTLGYAAAGTWNNVNYKNDPSTTTALNVGNQRYIRNWKLVVVKKMNGKVNFIL